jgi:hypothetical protein
MISDDDDEEDVLFERDVAMLIDATGRTDPYSYSYDYGLSQSQDDEHATRWGSGSTGKTILMDYIWRLCPELCVLHELQRLVNAMRMLMYIANHVALLHQVKRLA